MACNVRCVAHRVVECGVRVSCFVFCILDWCVVLCLASCVLRLASCVVCLAYCVLRPASFMCLVSFWCFQSARCLALLIRPAMRPKQPCTTSCRALERKRKVETFFVSSVSRTFVVVRAHGTPTPVSFSHDERPPVQSTQVAPVESPAFL